MTKDARHFNEPSAYSEFLPSGTAINFNEALAYVEYASQTGTYNTPNIPTFNEALALVEYLPVGPLIEFNEFMALAEFVLYGNEVLFNEAMAYVEYSSLSGTFNTPNIPTFNEASAYVEYLDVGVDSIGRMLAEDNQ
jgi:hypothetical protein